MTTIRTNDYRHAIRAAVLEEATLYVNLGYSGRFEEYLWAVSTSVLPVGWHKMTVPCKAFKSEVEALALMRSLNKAGGVPVGFRSQYEPYVYVVTDREAQEACMAFATHPLFEEWR